MENPADCSFYTTVLCPDEKLRRTHEAIQRSGVRWEHVVTVATQFEKAFDFLPEDAPDLTVLSTPGAGISEGFNVAIRQCRGKYLMVANSGDSIRNVLPLVAALDKHPELDFAYGNCSVAGTPVQARPSPFSAQQCYYHGMGFCHGASMTRSDFHDKFGYYDSEFRIAMDFQVYLQAVQRGARMLKVQTTVADIEDPGVSSSILARTRENYRIVRRFVPAHLALFIAVKWFIVATIVERAR